MVKQLSHYIDVTFSRQTHIIRPSLPQNICIPNYKYILNNTIGKFQPQGMGQKCGREKNGGTKMIVLKIQQKTEMRDKF